MLINLVTTACRQLTIDSTPTLTVLTIEDLWSEKHAEKNATLNHFLHRKKKLISKL